MENILLVGNPNSGKTTLFNTLTKSNEHVGNWHGVTVEDKRKVFDNGNFCLVDTPGVYSLSAFSFEEDVTINTIENEKYSKIIQICDISNLKRNLYLLLCLVERNLDVIVAINQIDKKNKTKVDTKKLSTLLGVDVVTVDAQKKHGVENLLNHLHAKTQNKGFDLGYLSSLNFEPLAKYHSNMSKHERFLFCINAYEKNERYFKSKGYGEDAIKEIFDQTPKDSIEQIAKARYDFLDDVFIRAVRQVDFVYGQSKLDKIFLNKYLAFPCFMLILLAVFYLTFFSVGRFLSDILADLLNMITTPLVTKLYSAFGDSFVYYLFSDAIFGGLATIVSFLPQVVLLFLFLSILEDSGYLSRVAFVFEDICAKVGLSGKSVYTLLMGFGCSTSAIMTSRNLDNNNGRIKTAMICSYMSCTAKIPIYTAIGGAFFGAQNIFVIIALYIVGIVTALVISKILDKTILKSEAKSFFLEFPPYRTTSPKRILKILWKNTKSFLFKVGSVMISMNVIIFLLSSFDFKFKFVYGKSGSILESLSKIIAPIFGPIGFNNWAIVSALIAGFVAKEIVVSSIAMFNGIDASASKLISESIMLESSVVFFASKASVLSFLIFCLLYTPCLASISMLLEEIGKKFTLIAIAIQLVVAYILSFMVYNISLAVEIWGVSVLVGIFALIVVCLAVFCIYRHFKYKKCGFCENCNKCKRN